MPMYAIFTAMLTLLLFLDTISSAQEPRVQEILVPKEATDVTYSKSRGDIRMKFPGDMKRAGAFYQQSLTQEKWRKSAKDNLQKNFWVQTFEREKQELQVRADNRDEGCEIRLTPKGFRWDEDFAPRPEEIPIPENASQLKYDDFFNAIEFQHEDSPKQLVEYYASTLDSKIWSKSSDDVAREDSGVLQRTSGSASIVIYIDAEDGMSQVKIDTKGMSWDQIKLANAKAMKNADATSSSATGSAKVPKRPGKPARGIDTLEKLPSIASVTIDGKKIPLPEIIAYELISYGQWRTHIVATAQPVKQATLVNLLRSNIPEEQWGEQWKLPSPNVVWILDDDDSLRSVHLLADKVPGSSTEVTGEAIVEAGRARGTVKLKPQKFFEHSYEADISFDTPLINPSSAPRTLLQNAAKLENAGKIILAGKTYSLPFVVAYEERSADRSVIRVLLTEKRIDAARVVAALKQSGEVPTSLIGFQTQISLALDENDVLSSMFLWCDGVSVNWSGNDSVQASVQSEGDRIRGTAKTVEKQDVLGKSFEFQASFDTSILGSTENQE